MSDKRFFPTQGAPSQDMRFFMRQSVGRRLNARFAAPLALAIVGLMFGSAGPALGERNAPAIWVAPDLDHTVSDTTRTGQQIDPGSFERAAVLPDLAPAAIRWVPVFLSPKALNQPNIAPPRQVGQAAAGETSFTLSDVLRASDWRRETAVRLRAKPAFKPVE